MSLIVKAFRGATKVGKVVGRLSSKVGRASRAHKNAINLRKAYNIKTPMQPTKIEVFKQVSKKGASGVVNAGVALGKSTTSINQLRKEFAEKHRESQMTKREKKVKEVESKTALIRAKNELEIAKALGKKKKSRFKMVFG